MDNDDEIMMKFLMQDKAGDVADQETDDGFDYSPSLQTSAYRSPSMWWFEGWEGAEQGSASTCRCTF
jgi:hypothetical protein